MARRPLVLQTARLELRPLTLDDLDDMASLLGDAEALRLWGAPSTVKEHLIGSTGASRGTRPMASGDAP
jgi:RimJ/RimL family protein N-acetyltransferase